MAKDLIAPHGGTLIDRLVPADQREALLARAESAPQVTLSSVSLSDVMLIAMGVVSPLKGFMSQADYEKVVHDMHLTTGEPWTIPIALPVTPETAETLTIGEDVALMDEAGNLVALLELSDKYSYDKEVEAENVYRTTEDAHPGVARVYAQPDMYLGGDIWVFDLPEPEFPNEFYTPAQSRAYFKEQGWTEIVAFQTRNPIHRAHEYLQKVAMEIVDGLMLHPLVGETKKDDVPSDIRMESYRVVIDNYYPKGRVLLNTFPAAMRYAGPREAVFHAICRKNYGCSHFIVGRDHAGVGKYYGTYDAQKIFDEFDRDAIDITPLKFEHAFYSKKEKKIVTAKTSIYGKDDWMFLSGTQVRALLTEGKDLPEEFTRPEVSKVLLKGYAQMRDESD
ncbi:MAG: sulfate adenylyltransferase [Chloroflexota bacterium]